MGAHDAYMHHWLVELRDNGIKKRKFVVCITPHDVVCKNLKAVEYMHTYSNAHSKLLGCSCHFYGFYGFYACTWHKSDRSCFLVGYVAVGYVTVLYLIPTYRYMYTIVSIRYVSGFGQSCSVSYHSLALAPTKNVLFTNCICAAYTEKPVYCNDCLKVKKCTGVLINASQIL